MCNCGCCDLLDTSWSLANAQLTSLLFAEALHALRRGHDCKMKETRLAAESVVLNYVGMIFFETLLRAAAKSARSEMALILKEQFGVDLSKPQSELFRPTVKLYSSSFTILIAESSVPPCSLHLQQSYDKVAQSRPCRKP
jgi:hypothetical protein